ncbi:XdhC family protein [Frateuria defendens]|uniref:XdhC family protein n=1 Tax=Frateuria defendens TaxID=2219559 RepID=UPI00066FB73B|nr:XdhC/CoxI family protein [Frateuria defendens]
MNTPQEFPQLLAAVQRLRAHQTPAALATIVRTRGSTFRRAGTSMLVHADGEVTCALSGGCPQRDIVLRALRAMAEGAPALVPYNREANFDVMMEMGCGGELEVLVEPLLDPADGRFLDVLAELHDARACGAVATVFSRDGAALAPRPWRLIHQASGHWTDIPVPALAERVRTLAAAVPLNARTAVERIEADGAQWGILLEVWRPTPALVVVGRNEGALALSRLAHGLGWQTTLVEHLASSPPAAPPDGVGTLIAAAPEALPQALAFDPQTAVVVMTHNFERDLAFVRALAPLPLAYLGVIGSRERAGRIREAVNDAATAIHAPAGLDIGSETAPEIALSVAAEIMAAMNARSGVRLSRTQGPIHP